MGELMPFWRRALLITLSIAAAGFIANALWHTPVTWETVQNTVSWQAFLWAMLPCVAMLCAKAIVHATLIEDFRERGRSLWLTLSAYAEAQLIRYVPGKVWGVIYQGERLSATTPRAVIWHANLTQMAISNLNGIGVMCGVLLLSVGHPLLGLSAFLIGLVVTGAFMIGDLMTYLLKLGTRFGWTFDLARRARLRPSRVMMQIALLEVDWLAYYLCWVILLHAQGDWFDAVLIGTVYAGAALIGLAVVVVPSGWFVREAAFIWLGGYSGLAADKLLILGLIARLFFVLGDALCAALLVSINLGHTRRTYES